MTMAAATIKEYDQIVCGWLTELIAPMQELAHQDLQVHRKEGDVRNLVTNVDKSNEQWLDEQIRRLDPTAQIISEEGYGDCPTSMAGHVWYVDPIDGTMNFVHEHRDFAIMLALYCDGQPVLGWIVDVMAAQIIHGGPSYGVWLDQTPLSTAENVDLDQAIFMLSGRRLVDGEVGYSEIALRSLAFRVIGSAGIVFSYIVKGQASGYYSKLQPWDVAAGRALVETLGFVVTKIDGQPLDMLSSNSVLVATNSAHRTIVQMLKG